MQRIIKKSIFIIYLSLFMMLFTGCVRVEQKEEELGVSYSNIVCEYYGGPTYGMIEEMFAMHITVYGNNTVEVWTGPFNYQDEVLEVIYSETFEITEEQKQDMIDTIRDNRIIELGDIGDPESCDGGDYYIRLFNENGEKVHSCGGTNPFNDNFSTVRDMILELVPLNDRNRIRKESSLITREMIERIDNYEEQGQLKPEGE